jgi:hypothetical protein
MLCLYQVHIVLEFKFILCLSSKSWCVLMQFYVVFEFKFYIIQWMYVIVHLVKMVERAQYLDVVTRVLVGMDSLGISVKVYLIFILLCVLSVYKSKSKRSWRNYWGTCLLCFSSNLWCVWFQIHVVLKCNLCCVWVQIHTVFEFRLIL